MFKIRGKMSLKLWKNCFSFLLTAIMIFSLTLSGLAQDPNGDANGEAEAASAGSGVSDEVIAQGQSIFNANCKMCHAINERVVGQR